MATANACYDWSRDYRWNYEHPPAPVEVDVPACPGEWRYCGIGVPSPLGIPAGPLLNGKWCLYYASLGFDVLTYKTVRSRRHRCYEMPNLQPVVGRQLRRPGEEVETSSQMRGSWAVSFGMPSADPDVWRKDVEETRQRLAPSKILSVSVVGTVQPGWTLDQLADDYAQCAVWAANSGADVVETNFSCPNVSTCDGQLYQIPRDAGLVARRVREAIGDVPYVIKIGHVADSESTSELLEEVAGVADGLAMTNSIAARVTQAGKGHLFDGQPRGICGDAIREESRNQVARFTRLIQAGQHKVAVIAVGGAANAAHVRAYLEAGAAAVQLATAAMLRPQLALEIRAAMAR